MFYFYGNRKIASKEKCNLQSQKRCKKSFYLPLWTFLLAFTNYKLFFRLKIYFPNLNWKANISKKIKWIHKVIGMKQAITLPIIIDKKTFHLSFWVYLLNFITFIYYYISWMSYLGTYFQDHLSVINIFAWVLIMT